MHNASRHGLGHSHADVVARRGQAWGLRATPRSPELAEVEQAADTADVQDRAAQESSEPPSKGTKLTRLSAPALATRCSLAQLAAGERDVDRLRQCWRTPGPWDSVSGGHCYENLRNNNRRRVWPADSRARVAGARGGAPTGQGPGGRSP